MPFNQWFQTVLHSSLAICRIKAVAVYEVTRGQGVGSRVVRTCNSTYQSLGYSISCRQMPPAPGLDAVYRKQRSSAVDRTDHQHTEALGYSVNLDSDDLQRIFVWRVPVDATAPRWAS